MTTMAKKDVQYKESKVWTPAQIILVACVAIFVLLCVMPFINVIAVSFSSKSAILRGAVSFWPVEFNTTAYEVIFRDKSLINCLFYTIELTVIYTAIAMVMTILLAYPLTKQRRIVYAVGANLPRFFRG